MWRRLSQHVAWYRVAANAAYDTPAPLNGLTNYVRNGLNQYYAGGAFSYDGRGNLTSAQSTVYGYDTFNRLTNAGTATFAYDAAGRLRESVAGSTTTRFLYDGADMIAEYNSSNALLRRYVFGPGVDEALVWYEGTGTGDRRYLVADERGSIVAVTNGAGAASGTGFGIHTYDEYGTPGPNNNGRFQYTGQAWLPEAQLYLQGPRLFAVARPLPATRPDGKPEKTMKAYAASIPAMYIRRLRVSEPPCIASPPSRLRFC